MRILYLIHDFLGEVQRACISGKITHTVNLSDAKWQQ